MSKPKTYVWVNPKMKRALKIRAAKKNKCILDLLPEDFGISERPKKRDPFKFRL